MLLYRDTSESHRKSWEVTGTGSDDIVVTVRWSVRSIFHICRPWVGFSSDALLRFAGFLRCDSLTIMQSFLKKIAPEFSENFMRFLCKFPEHSLEKPLHYCTTIALQESCEKPANRRGASDEKPTPGVDLDYTCTYGRYCLINITLCL